MLLYIKYNYNHVFRLYGTEICCITSLIVMSLEERVEGRRVFGGQHLFQESAHMLRHRVGARGNATCFLMPWKEILAKFAENDDVDAAIPDLPRTGPELARCVQLSTVSDSSGAAAGFRSRPDVLGPPSLAS